MRIFWRSLLAVLATATLVTCLWLPIVTFNDQPPWEAGEQARMHALAEGYAVQNSGFKGEYITQPDSFGGCEIEVFFFIPVPEPEGSDVVVGLKRSSAIVGWQVTYLVVRKCPAERPNLK